MVACQAFSFKGGGGRVGDFGFAARLAYLRWVFNAGRTEALKDAEFASRIGVGTKWLGKWKSRADAPPGRAEAQAIEAALRPWGATIAWLYDNDGAPPFPALWQFWHAQASTDAEHPVVYGWDIPDADAEAASRERAAKLAAQTRPRAKNAVGGRKRRGHPRDDR